MKKSKIIQYEDSLETDNDTKANKIQEILTLIKEMRIKRDAPVDSLGAHA